jgi:hypothetical protein
MRNAIDATEVAVGWWPGRPALAFATAVASHACGVCDWGPELAGGDRGLQ